MPRQAWCWLVVAIAATHLGVSPPKAPKIDAPAQRMSERGLQDIIRAAASESQGEGNVLQFVYAGVRMACISDRDADRMRIIAPIKTVAEMKGEEVARVLEANFHTALDARYGTSDGILYAAYIHPLSPLRNQDVLSALSQVAALARSYGDSYSSGDLEYGIEPAPE